MFETVLDLIYFAAEFAPSHHHASAERFFGTAHARSTAVAALSLFATLASTSLGATITPPLTPAKIVR